MGFSAPAEGYLAGFARIASKSGLIEAFAHFLFGLSVAAQSSWCPTETDTKPTPKARVRYGNLLFSGFFCREADAAQEVLEARVVAQGIVFGGSPQENH